MWFQLFYLWENKKAINTQNIFLHLSGFLIVLVKTAHIYFSMMYWSLKMTHVLSRIGVYINPQVGKTMKKSSIFFNNPNVKETLHIQTGADLVKWGPQAKIGMGLYTFAYIYLDQPWGSCFVVMLAAAQWCPIVESNLSAFFMSMLWWDSFIYMYSFRRHLLFHVLDNKIAIDLPLRYKF